MLERTWRKGSSHTVLMRMKIGVATVEDTIEIPQKVKNRSSYSGLFIQNAAAAKLLPSCPTLCDPIDGSPPGSPVPGILQARILEWVAISFSSEVAHRV